MTCGLHLGFLGLLRSPCALVFIRVPRLSLTLTRRPSCSKDKRRPPCKASSGRCAQARRRRSKLASWLQGPSAKPSTARHPDGPPRCGATVDHHHVPHVCSVFSVHPPGWKPGLICAWPSVHIVCMFFCSRMCLMQTLWQMFFQDTPQSLPYNAQ